MPAILKYGMVLRLKNELATVVVTLNRSSENGWDCVCVASKNPVYHQQEIFVFDEELHDSEPITIFMSTTDGDAIRMVDK